MLLLAALSWSNQAYGAGGGNISVNITAEPISGVAIAIDRDNPPSGLDIIDVTGNINIGNIFSDISAVSADATASGIYNGSSYIIIQKLSSGSEISALGGAANTSGSDYAVTSVTGIRSIQDITIDNLDGTVSATGGSSEAEEDAYASAYGIRGNNINITNLTGTVNAAGGTAYGGGFAFANSYGIYASTNINITNQPGNINVSGGTTECGPAVFFDEATAVGMYAQNAISIGNLTGSIDITGGNAKHFANAIGISSDTDIGIYTLSGEINAAGGYASEAYADATAKGISGGTIEIAALSGEINARGGCGYFTDTWGIKGTDIDIDVFSGSVSAMAGSGYGTEAYGIFGKNTVSVATFTGSIETYGGKGYDGLSEGISGNTITIGTLSGSIKASGGSGYDGEAAGISGNTITIGTLSGSVEAISSNAVFADAYGIKSSTGLSIGSDDDPDSGISGTISATAEKGLASEKAYALFSWSNYSDFVAMSGAGRLIGNVYLDGGNDTMLIRNSAVISTVPVLDGGSGGETTGDELIFENWTGTLGPSVINWETISLTDGSAVILPDSDSHYVFTYRELMIDPTSTLDVSNNAQTYILQNIGTSGTVKNAGTISQLDNNTDSQMTINDDYVGEGGCFAMDINTSNSTADQVTINGNATGSTSIVVNELGDPEPFNDPMTLIIVSGDTSPDAFSVSNRLYGPYQYVYTLEFDDGDAKTFSIVDVDKFHNDYAALLQGVTPCIEQLGYASVMKFHERSAYGWFRNDDVEHESWWVRSTGSRYRLGLDGGAGTRFDGYVGWLQIGTDLIASEKDGKRFDLGLFAGVGYGKTEVDGIWSDKAGELSQTAYGGGFYLSLHERGTWYLDAVGQAICNDLSIDSLSGGKYSADVWSWIASVEAGGCIDAGESFRLQPQVQLIYQHTGGIDLSTAVGDVSIGDHDGLQGRLSLTGLAGASKDAINPFVEVSLVKDFSGSSEVTYAMGEETVAASAEEWFIGGAIGLSREVSKKNNLGYYVKAGSMHGLGGLDSYTCTILAGLKAKF